MSKQSIFYPLVIGEHNPILRKKSEPLHVFDTDVKEFADILLTLMYEYDGIGLAAPQLGKNIRMIAVTQRKQEKSNTKNSHGRQKIKRTLVGEYVMINPEIIEHSSAKQTTEEGCLSVPGILGEVERYLRVKVKYQDKNGNIGIKKVRGLDAVVVQHEIDHLDGILFTDKVIRLT